MTDYTTAKTVAAGLQAVAEPTRLLILRALAGGPRHVTELAKLLNLEIVNVSHHLGVMRSAKLVVDEKKGRYVTYSLNEDLFSVSSKWVLTLNLGWCSVDFQPDAPAAAAPSGA